MKTLSNERVVRTTDLDIRIFYLHNITDTKTVTMNCHSSPTVALYGIGSILNQEGKHLTLLAI